MELYIVEDYLLFINQVSDRNTKFIMGTNYAAVFMNPECLDVNIPSVDLIFEARTNYNGFSRQAYYLQKAMRE